MLLSNIPPKIPTPFAASAGGSYIRTVPVPSQIGVVAGAASFTDGFPPLTFVPAGSGGYPPDGRDMNYLLNLLSQWARWFAAGGIPQYDATFATAIGGYPNKAILAASAGGSLWQSTVDNNTTNPDTGGANWQAFLSFPSLTRLAFQQSTAPTGWTKDTGVTSDAVMRLTTGTVSSGGSQAFSVWNATSVTGAHGLTVAEMPIHNHTITDPGHAHGNNNGQFYGLSPTTPNAYYSGSAASLIASTTANTATHTTGISLGNTGSGNSHTHPITNSVFYLDFIVCQKN